MEPPTAVLEPKPKLAATEMIWAVIWDWSTAFSTTVVLLLRLLAET